MDHKIFDSSIARFRLAEAGKPDASGLAIDVHIISPGWGSSGYYSDLALQKGCEAGVYPLGMHMHLDHPTREAEQTQPARTISGESPLVAVLTVAGHYLESGWDKTPDNPTGAGVYAMAKVLPRYVEDLKALAGSIGISHYVSGKSEVGVAPDGRKGPIITELIADPMNTVDFVTVPGAGGHYRTLFESIGILRATNTESTKAIRAREALAETYLKYGYYTSIEDARRAAGIHRETHSGDSLESIEARKRYRDALVSTGSSISSANRLAGLEGDP